MRRAARSRCICGVGGVWLVQKTIRSAVVAWSARARVTSPRSASRHLLRHLVRGLRRMRENTTLHTSVSKQLRPSTRTHKRPTQRRRRRLEAAHPERVVGLCPRRGEQGGLRQGPGRHQCLSRRDRGGQVRVWRQKAVCLQGLLGRHVEVHGSYG